MVGQADAVDSALSSVAAAAGARLFEITQEIWRLLTDDIPQLRGDDVVEKLLAASVEENVATLLHVLEHGTVADEVDAPAAAVEYARRLAQRDMPIGALVRAYRIGHGRFLGRCIEEIATRSTDAGLTAAVTDRMVEVSFRYIDRVSEQVVETYQRERDRWLLTQTAMRAARVRAILGDQPVDIAATESALGYRLGQYHLGTTIRIAVGEPGHGVEGFRETHRQAARTQDLALAARPGARLTTFADAGAVALLAADIPAARSWVWATLGNLALDDDQHARLRDTLLVFLSTGSYITTAERMTMHKNSVQYRIRKAREAVGSPIGDRRSDVELALRACSRLGRTVLRPARSV